MAWPSKALSLPFPSGHPGQASLRGDVDTSVVGWPRRDALRPHAAAHSCALAGAAPGREEGGVMAAGGGTAPCHPLPLTSLPLAMDLLAPTHVRICQLAKSRRSHLSWQAGRGVVAVAASGGAGPL